MQALKTVKAAISERSPDVREKAARQLRFLITSNHVLYQTELDATVSLCYKVWILYCLSDLFVAPG